MQDIYIDFSKELGPMKPLHGINNGPISRGISTDTSVFYKKLSPPFARLHDTHYPESREVDIHTIFPDMTKDAEDPANYNFKLTDAYLKSILDLGTDIIYRLGETIASPDKYDYIHPPEDYKKYARVCVNIIRHYNEGWADGFCHGIRHWEFWNEPSVPNMWTGSMEQWLDLYREVALAIKEHDPDLLVGGPAACDSLSPINIPFLEYVSKHKLPLDFYTFHSYTNGSEQAAVFLETLKSNLEKYGFGSVRAYITEWNYSPKGPDGSIFWDFMPKADVFQRAAMHRKLTEPEGASHAALFLCILQNSYVQQANFYSANTDGKFSCFDKYGIPVKTYYSLLAYKKLYDLGTQVEAIIKEEVSDLAVLAATDGPKGLILISNFNNDEEEYQINLAGGPDTIKSVRVINKKMDLLPLRIKPTKNKVMKFRIPRHTVVLVEVGE